MSVLHHTAIVSGGNTGIGAAIARGLLAEALTMYESIGMPFHSKRTSEKLAHL